MSVERKMEERVYTYGDILTFPDPERWELIDGTPYLQADPSGTHIRIAGQLNRHFLNYLDGKPCEALREFPIWPEGKPKHKNAKGRIVPDLLVYCEPKMYTEDGLIGVPDLVIEILSPSNFKEDKIVKFNKYLEMGVREYWIVSPEYRYIEVNILDGDCYRTTLCTESVRYNDFEIELTKIFPPLPQDEE
jgi:Uma2 family endonuclease